MKLRKLLAAVLGVNVVGLPQLPIQGKFTWKQIRNGNVIAEGEFKNGSTNVGVHALLDLYFRNSGSAAANWYIGIIDNASFSALSATDTMASHVGWQELTEYDEATRVAWAPAAAATRAVSNSTVRNFTFNATKTVKGIFITDTSTKGGATGVLWATGTFPSTVNVVDNDIISITYTVSVP